MSRLERFHCVVIVVAVAATVSGAPLLESGAHYVDTDSADGAVSGGVLDPTLTQLGPATADGETTESDADTVTKTWADYAHDTGGGDTVTNTLELSTENATVGPAVVDLTISYAENDTADGMSGNAESTAQTIAVDEFVYDGTDLTNTTFIDENGNGRLDLDDLTMTNNDDNLSSLSGIGAGSAQNLTITLSGKATLLDIISSGDGIDFHVAIRATRSSFVDADAARVNTIQYA